MVIATGHLAAFDINDHVTRAIARIDFSMMVGGFRGGYSQPLNEHKKQSYPQALDESGIMAGRHASAAAKKKFNLIAF
jgi:hypothetical protein